MKTTAYSAAAATPAAAASTATADQGAALAKNFDPGKIERHWYPQWQARGYFAAGAKAGRPAFGIQLPPPNVTGILHMGHAFNQTIMDALTRYHRMLGDNTLWLPGTDHAGIATQIVVERQLEQQGIGRRELGRTEFIARVWDWQRYSGDTILLQMKRLGDSCDWERAYFTLDERRSRAVTEAFVALHAQGLIYRGQRLVNWDPQLQTAVSDLEVESAEEDGHLWEISYPRAGGGPGVVVATTRPETLLGDVAVAVHPDDARYADLAGTFLELPLCERQIPLLADAYVDPAFGTGCVKITPAHDFNDFALGQRHGLTPIAIFTTAATVNDQAPERFRGLDRYAARAAVLAELRAAGLLLAERPHRMMVPRCARSGAVVEPMLSQQWYVAMSQPTPPGTPHAGKSLAQIALEAVDSGAVRIVPDQWRLVYRQWLTNIQDWCISRQLWWGHQIPAWRDTHGRLYVARDADQAQAQARAAGAGAELERDPDVLDTWFSSALVPFASLDPAAADGAYDRYLPSSVVVTGHEILFFWVARMIFMTAHFTGRVPFRDVYIHGIVRDAEGRKMSKSEGNTIDPVDLLDGIGIDALVRKNTAALRRPEDAPRIAQRLRRDFPDGVPAYGADALRLTMAAYASLGRNVNFDFKRCEGYRNFCNKLWNAARFVQLNATGQDCADGAVSSGHSCADRWIVGALQRTAAQVRRGFAEYRLDHVAQAIYHFAWDQYCDWYLELAKVQLAQGDAQAQRATRQTLVQVLEALLRLAHPIIPFITEELWQSIALLAGTRAANTTSSIMIQPYPLADPARIDAVADARVQSLQRLIDAVRALRSARGLAPSSRVPLVIAPPGPQIAEFTPYLMGLARIASVTTLSDLASHPQAGSAPVAVVDDYRILLAIEIDVAAERARLLKELARFEGEIVQAQTRLANPNFVERAPPPVVAELRERLSRSSAARARLAEEVGRLPS